MWWGSMQAKVHLLDLAAMAKYAYDEWETDEHYTRLLKESFGEQNVENVYYDPAKRFPRVVAARLCRNGEAGGAGPCTIIMAVRGTSNKIEILTDISLFSTVVVMQMLDKMVPLLGTLPVAVLSSIIGDFRHPFMKQTQHEIMDDLTSVAKNLTRRYPYDKLVLTGHSLGGSFAELIGARMRIPAVGFSAPGQFYLLKTFKVHREQIEQTLLTIMPSLDPVPHVASHIDMVQRIQCRLPTGKHRPPWACHSLDGTSCELWRVCGDPLLRDFSKVCLGLDDTTSNMSNPMVNGSCRGLPFGGKTAECLA
jgi:putative lipase involved disintegration of autophagic bodies